jgi:hypothetical protein
MKKVNVKISVNEFQLESIRELLNLPDDVSDERCIELFIVENTCIDEDGESF